MVPRRFERFIDPATRQRVASIARVADEDGMQDWPLEVADAQRIDEFIALLHKASDDNERFGLMSLVLHSVGDADETTMTSFWPTIEGILEQDPLLYAHEIIYWSDGEEVDGGAWRPYARHGLPLAHLMRRVLARVAGRLRLHVFL